MKHMLTAGGLMLALARVVEAHPGHGAGGGSYALWHYVTEPMHAAAGAALLATAAAVTLWLRRERHTRRSDRLAG